MSVESDEAADSEIDRLKSMAQKLRAEAAALEAEKARALADAAEGAFRRFDTNRDGEISAKELKEGLEKSLKVELSDRRVKELMDAFDASGDGALQLDEFVTIDRFRTKLDQLAREEKELAIEAAKRAKEEEEAAALAQAKAELLNDGVPTNSDKVVSVLPYLFPLMDGLAYGRFLLQGADASNPFVDIVAALYLLYRSVPFSGFIAFFALNILSGNPGINRLVRFNMQQAIFLDIALFFPGLVTGLLGLIGGAAGLAIPPAVTELSTDAIFLTLLAVLGYCTVSSLLGITPDKVPLISDNVSNQMPTIDMFDDEGRYVPKEIRDMEEETKRQREEEDEKKK